MHFKQHIGLKYAELVYFGLWFTPLREALDAFVDNTQKDITGTATLSLYTRATFLWSAASRSTLFTGRISRPSRWAIAMTRKMQKDSFAFWGCRRARAPGFAQTRSEAEVAR